MNPHQDLSAAFRILARYECIKPRRAGCGESIAKHKLSAALRVAEDGDRLNFADVFPAS